MDSIDTLRALWEKLFNPHNSCPDVSLDDVLVAMCDLLSAEGFGGGNTPFQCWILAYFSLAGEAEAWELEVSGASERSHGRDLVTELQDLKFRGFLLQDGSTYRIKP